MNSDLQLINEVKTSKIFIAYCLARYNFNHTFISNISMQICQIIYPPVTAVFCFLSYILSTVPMVIQLYSESKTSVWREGGEQCFSVGLVLLLLQVHGLHFTLVLINKLLSTVLFSGSSAEMHLTAAHSSWCSHFQKSTLIWDFMIFSMEGRGASFSLYSLL